MKEVKLSMTEREETNIYYVCSLIEYISRKSKNHRKTVIGYFSKENIEHQLYAAEVNHCLSFEQVSDELIEDYNIQIGKLIPVCIIKIQNIFATLIWKENY